MKLSHIDFLPFLFKGTRMWSSHQLQNRKLCPSPEERGGTLKFAQIESTISSYCLLVSERGRYSLWISRGRISENLPEQVTFGDLLDSSSPLTHLLHSLAPKGRLIVIGSIASYKDNPNSNQMKEAVEGQVPTSFLLTGSRTVSGFLLFHYRKQQAKHLSKLISLHEKGLGSFN